jgi:hypothetical protein
MKKLLLIIVIAFLAASTLAHPLKMAYTAVKFNAEKQVFEIGHRVFQDDFEATLIAKYHYTGEDVFKAQKLTNTRQTIDIFFQKNFNLSINGKAIKTKYVGIEQKHEMGIIIWYETEKIDISQIKQIKVYNSIMMESFKEQVNMFNLNINDFTKRTLKYEYKKREETINI